MAGPAAVSARTITDDPDYDKRTAYRTTTIIYSELSVSKNVKYAANPLRMPQTSALLRNIIWELVVVGDGGWVEIDIDIKLKAPGLLSICVQIRDEASAMYHKLNKFWTDARAPDIIAVSQWLHKSAAARFLDVEVYVVLPREVDVVLSIFLTDWCADVFGGEDIRTALACEGMDKTERFVCDALAFVADAREAYEWTDVKEILEERALAAADSVSIDWTDHTFADGFYLDGEDSYNKVCDHTEEERGIVDCEYCPLDCTRFV